MDNKKWGKRFSTIFWWILTILPLIIALIYFIGYHFTFNSGITSDEILIDYHIASDGDFGNYLYYVLEDFFKNFSIYYLYDMFELLGEYIHVDNAELFGMLFGYMASVQFYHVMYDVCVWIFRIIHSWLERWC